MLIKLPYKGDGFLLRNFVPSDWEKLADIEFDDENKKFSSKPVNKSRSQFISGLREMSSEAIAIIVPDEVLTGRADLTKYAPFVQELTLIIDKFHWRQDLGKKIIRSLIRHAFFNEQIIEVVAIVHP